jgi:hypothetical protein
VHVAQAALAALGHQQALAVLGEIADDFVGLDVHDHGADWHGDSEVVAGLAVHLPAHAVLATLGLELGLVAEVDERIEVFVGHQPDATAIAAIATIGATERNELLAAEANATVLPPSPAMNLDFGFVDESSWDGAKDREWEIEFYQRAYRFLRGRRFCSNRNEKPRRSGALRHIGRALLGGRLDADRTALLRALASRTRPCRRPARTG